MPKTIVLVCRKLAHNGSIAGVGGLQKGTEALNHYTEAEAIRAIDDRLINFEVHDPAGHVAHVRVAHHGEHRFLETHRDGVKTDNLDDLPICRHVPISPTPAPPPVYRPARQQSGHCVAIVVVERIRK